MSGQPGDPPRPVVAAGIDFVVRFALAGAVALFAAYTRVTGWPMPRPSITCPVLAISRFAPLVGAVAVPPCAGSDAGGRAAGTCSAASARARAAGDGAGGEPR